MKTKLLLSSALLMICMISKAQTSKIQTPVTSYTFNFNSPTAIDTLDVGDTLNVWCGNIVYTTFESITTAASTTTIGVVLVTGGGSTVTYTYTQGIKLETNVYGSDNHRFIITNPCQTKFITIKRYSGSGSTFDYLDFHVRPNTSNALIENQKLEAKIYPNPVLNDLIIETKTNKPMQISIYNMIGELVFSDTYSKKVNLEKLLNGIYTLRIVSDDKIYTQKIIKQ